MCGIAGFWQTKRGQVHPQETLDRMGAALAHRGPDDSGIYQDAATGIGLAFRRLSILDLSPEGHQPMFSPSGRYIIVFNGEVYNFEEIRSELRPQRWRGHSDTEVMLAAFEQWGMESTVKRFVGMFAFVLWDRQERTLYLVRDRLGIKPLYYGHAGEDFVFGSELKAIRQHPDFSGEIDRDVLALYMRHNYVPSPHCIYKGLYKLQPGYVLTLNSAADLTSLHPFWSAEDVAREGLQSPFDGSDAEAIEHLHDKLSSAVRLRMIADVPLGAFLSGGVDSSTVVSLMQAQSSRPVKTFSIGFHEGGYDEARHARRVAEYLGTEHTELYLTPKDALAVVPLLPAIYDEPFSDPSQIPTYLVSKLARNNVTVSLSGDGGDELFGGYNRYSFTRSVWSAIKIFPRSVRKAAAKLLQAVSPAGIDGSVRRFRSILPQTMRLSTPGDKVHKLADLLSVQNQSELYYRVLSHSQNQASVVRNHHEPATLLDSILKVAWLPNMEEVMMLTDQLNYLPDDILTKVDRASMAVSLEARVPLLDHRVVEFAWRLPVHFKVRNGIRKWVLRQILYKYVPPALIERPKMGFSVPINSWLRGPLREWAEDLLSVRSLAQHGLLDVALIQVKWQEHLSGIRNWQNMLWDVLVFQGWFCQNKLFCQRDEPLRGENTKLREKAELRPD